MTSSGPSRVATSFPVSASQIFTVPSMLPVARNLPVLENPTAITESVCPVSSKRRSPVEIFQIKARSSPPPVAAMSWNSGWMATE